MEKFGIDEIVEEVASYSWGYLIPFAISTLPVVAVAALVVLELMPGDYAVFGRDESVWDGLAYMVGLLIAPSVVTTWWVGWRYGNRSATRCVVVSRWMVLFGLLPITLALFYGGEGSVFEPGYHWAVGLHVPVYLMSWFGSRRWSRRRTASRCSEERLEEMELAEAAVFVGRRCFICRRRIVGGQLARGLESGQVAHKSCEHRDWCASLGAGPGWIVMAAVLFCVVAYSWWPAAVTGSVLALLRPSVVALWLGSWCLGRVGGEGVTDESVYLRVIGRVLLVFLLELIWLGQQFVMVEGVEDFEAEEFFSQLLAVPVGWLVVGYLAAWFGGELVSSWWREVSGPVTRVLRRVRLA